MKRLALVATLTILALSLLLSTTPTLAKTAIWKDATVLKLTSQEKGTEAVVVPIGNGIYGAAGPIERAYYWIKTEKVTYVIHNYSNGTFIQRWLVLTIGGMFKYSLDGRDIHIIDDEGKDRAMRVVAKYTNEALP